MTSAKRPMHSNQAQPYPHPCLNAVTASQTARTTPPPPSLALQELIHEILQPKSTKESVARQSWSLHQGLWTKTSSPDQETSALRGMRWAPTRGQCAEQRPEGGWRPARARFCCERAHEAWIVISYGRSMKTCFGEQQNKIDANKDGAVCTGCGIANPSPNPGIRHANASPHSVVNMETVVRVYEFRSIASLPEIYPLGYFYLFSKNIQKDFMA